MTFTSCRGVKYHEPGYWKFGDEGNEYFCHAIGEVRAGGRRSQVNTVATLFLKDRRKRPEGGEWEPIKIPHRNLTYIPKPT
jgi:hypothetical protein